MEKQKFSVSLNDIINNFNLKIINKVDDVKNRFIDNNEVNRPGLQIAGFFDYFDNTRIQVIGRVEITYLERLNPETRLKALDKLFKTKLPCVIVTRDLKIPQEMIDFADEYNTPLLRSPLSTSRFMSALIAYLNVCLAPRITMHGVLVEVYGEGILLLGDSGVGKSETAIELVKRGHRLVADDAVEIKRVSDKTLVGVAPEIIRHFIELRGIGIIDVKQIFGMGSVKDTEKIDMIIHLEIWQDGKMYDRLGMNTEYTSVLDVGIPSLTIPVKPGRNLAIIVEVAAMNNRQKRMGINAAETLNEKLMKKMNKDALKTE